jgi:hypothetical protein
MQKPSSYEGYLIVEVSRLHTIRHTNTRPRLDSSEWVICLSQKSLSTQHITKTAEEIHALSRIRTSDPSNQVAADLCLRPHSHQNQHKIHVAE